MAAPAPTARSTPASTGTAEPSTQPVRCPELAFAQGIPLACEGVKRSRHGWLGLVQAADGHALAPLTSRATDLGDQNNGICALEESFGGLALRGAGFGPRPLVTATLAGDSDCRLPSAQVKLGSVAWSVSVSQEGVLRLASGTASVEYGLGSSCWTSLLIALVDDDPLPDVVAVRDGGGIVTVLGLSSTARGKAPVPPCTALARPPD